MRLRPILSSMLYLPLSMVRKDRLISDLTIKIYDKYAGEQVIKMYDLSKKNYIGVPRQFGLDTFPSIRYVDRTVRIKGNPRLFTCDIKPKNSMQKLFMNDLANICNTSKPVDCLANAKTGSGKTVSDLWLTAKLGIPTLVVVHTTKLQRQWIERIREFFGDEWAHKYLGRVRQDVCDFSGRLICIGLLPSLVRRNYGRAFYRYFGKTTFDEVHRMGAPLMSDVFKKLPAGIRVSYTATNKTGQKQKIIEAHIGEPRVVSKQEVLKPIVHIIHYKKTKALNDFSDHTLLTHVAMLEDRNFRLARLVYTKGIKRSRNIVVLSDRVKQLQVLQKILIDDFGVDKKEIGLHVGEYYPGNYSGWIRFEDGSKSGKVCDTSRNGVRKMLKELHPKECRDSSTEIEINEIKLKVPDKELDRITEECSVILATFGIFAEGVDVPRIDMGFEASPKGNVTQALGRILREFPGKPTPEWYSIYDRITNPARVDSKFIEPGKEYYAFLEGRARARLSSYRQQGAIIKEYVK